MQIDRSIDRQLDILIDGYSSRDKCRDGHLFIRIDGHWTYAYDMRMDGQIDIWLNWYVDGYINK